MLRKLVTKRFVGIEPRFVARAMNSSSAHAQATQPGPVETKIRNKLLQSFQPVHIGIMNESYMHSVPKGSETHFKVLVVSDKFTNKKLIERHRMVNETLKEELQGPVHALSIVAKTPEQWESMDDKTIGKSPPCLGGAGL